MTIESGSGANAEIKRIRGKWRIQEVQSGHGQFPVKMGGQKQNETSPPHQISSTDKLQLTLVSISDKNQ